MLRYIYLLVSSLMIFVLIGCGNADNSNDINSDLIKYLDKDKIYQTVFEEPFGTDGPEIVYASEKYAVIFNYNGTLIYDFENNIICGGIDNRLLGMSFTQGDNATFFKCNDELIFIYNQSMTQKSEYEKDKKSGYLYSIAENKLSYVDNMDLNIIDNTDNSAVIKFNEENTRDKIYKNLFENKNIDSGFSAYPRKNDIVIFEYLFNPNLSNDDGSKPYLEFKLYTISNDFELLKEYNLI